MSNMTITVICDNNPYKENLKTRWGFSALVTGAGKNILFDTGPDSSLLDNMEKLAIDPGKIDMVFLSHIHADHTGGLNPFLRKNPDVTVCLPQTFPKKLKDEVRNSGAKIIEVEKAVEICEGVYSTGRLGNLIKEQSLIIRTGKGPVLITGCAHPGIVKIINAARNLMKNDIIFVMGGFHLELATKGKIERIISAFKKMGVVYVGPAHCTGHRATELFEQHFSRNCVKTGAGKIITLEDLS